ncbi:alpha/beta fold hydrolase [Brachybacterium sp. GCM10030252]|uniref:alpha/beta fold hydrolase n=1 Tax=Brachybacterium sp. GCM10030252 TaxID=3273380 RepID=UPI0036193E38
MTASPSAPAAPTPSLPEPVPIDLGGVRIATYEFGADGSASRGDVLFCHGTPWSAQVWAPVARALSVTFRVHLWDMPGYGRSGKEADVPLDLVTQSERFARLLEHWQLESPHVIAHDIGGAVALGAHLRGGSQFASLALWDVVTLDPWGSPFFRLVAEHADVFSALPPALHAALVREYISGAAHRTLTAEQSELLVSPWIEGEGQAGFYRQIAALSPEHTEPLVERLHQVRCPVRIGWGEQDPWIPVEQASRLQEALPGEPPLAVLPDVGHLAPIEATEPVATALAEWLAGAADQGASASA